MNIIILTKKDQYRDALYKISDDRFIHIKNILKLEVGDFVEIGIINGLIGDAKIMQICDTEVLIKIISFEEKLASAHSISIVCALPRPQTLKKVLSICATIGVSNLNLIRSEKVEKSYFHSPLLNEENYIKYLIEGLSQGKRTILPKVSIHHKFKEFFENYFTLNYTNHNCLLAHPKAENYLSKIEFKSNKGTVIAIGPEGGWNNFEISFMEDIGFVKFKLSESILRVESAVTAALAQIELVNNNA